MPLDAPCEKILASTISSVMYICLFPCTEIAISVGLMRIMMPAVVRSRSTVSANFVSIKPTLLQEMMSRASFCELFGAETRCAESEGVFDCSEIALSCLACIAFANSCGVIGVIREQKRVPFIVWMVKKRITLEMVRNN